MNNYSQPIYYKLDENNNVIGVEGGYRPSWPNKLIKRDDIEHSNKVYKVSTVFLARDMNDGFGPRHCFETAIFELVNGEMGALYYIERCGTYDKSLSCHAEAIKYIKNNNCGV